jgi:hypothetical protein
VLVALRDAALARIAGTGEVSAASDQR